MVPLNLVLRGGTHPSRPRGSGDQRALIRRENIFPRRYRVFQANCSNTTIDYTCTFTGAKRSLSLSPLEFDDLLEKNIGGKKKGEEGINTDTKAHNGRKQNSATGVKTSNSVANEGSIRTYIYIPCARDVVAIFSPTSSESLRLLQFFRAISIREPQEFAISKEKKRKETDSSILYSRLFRDRNLRGCATDNHARPPR